MAGAGSCEGMLDVNLSTRPFYNERAVHLALGAAGLAAGAALVAGLLQASTLSRERALLTAAAERDEDALRENAATAAAVSREVRAEDAERLAAAAAEANALIDRRMFSWTEFFNRIEQTLPDGVMLTSVRPDVAADGVTVALGVIGRRVADIDAFIARLEATGAFAGVLPREETVTGEGARRTLLVGRYAPGSSGAAASGPEADR